MSSRTLSRFLLERVELGVDDVIPLDELTDALAEWCSANQVAPISEHELAGALRLRLVEGAHEPRRMFVTGARLRSSSNGERPSTSSSSTSSTSSSSTSKRRPPPPPPPKVTRSTTPNLDRVRFEREARETGGR